ncbi:MarR family winged helix-turn-helix transcriptional regulator [Spirosoma montaniterrae]|uniref:MarR family transcriptional regulator n=1 Tax=Spirosoma montaniterrae TaxID=1178516 RepID=A0A1P9WS55_9BACT|nr:winged helix DNA-binding protein [Spirosoma montaniterrae]AQG78180.1 MarR family transcriptional regulator [Spirosoma montaniterrae]
MDQGERRLIELVNAWATYSEARTEADVAGFCLHYLTEHTQVVPSEHHHPVTEENGLRDEQWVESLTGKANKSLIAIRPEARLGALVGRMAKYAYLYSKKAMQPLDFRSIDDPVYLIVLVQMGTPKKSELIYEMMAEFASGIDVINRLMAMGYVEEFPDEHDRRSKRLRITEQGLAGIQRAFPVMDRVADVAYSSLTDGEKALLVHILDKLDRYHADHYRQSRNADFDDVYDRMVGNKLA